jgi:transposase
MALSMDLRERIIKAYENGEGSIRTLAKRFSIGIASVWRLLKCHSTGRSIEAKSPPGRNRIIDDKGHKTIHQLLKEDNDATLEELCKRFAAKTKVKVSIVTMHRACRRLKIKYKKNFASD